MASGESVSAAWTVRCGSDETINDVWESNKAEANKLDLLGRLDYMHELTTQINWQQNSGNRPFE